MECSLVVNRIQFAYKRITFNVISIFSNLSLQICIFKNLYRLVTHVVIFSGCRVINVTLLKKMSNSCLLTEYLIS